MHTFGESGAGSGVPAFLAKLWRLVEDPETNHLICWSQDGRSFILQNQAQFARELLPLNYKHNNMASFIRQLNMYGFHKITSIENGGLKFDRDEMEFSHPYFKRDCPYLLENIKRKIATTKVVEEKATLKPETVGKVLNEVKVMRGRQESLDSRFSMMKQENEALWREIASLRQKHIKQQQIVNKLIQFLVTIVQPSRNMTGVKRHFQLMINDSPQNTKPRRSDVDNGPVIHELTEGLLDEVTEDDETDLINNVGPNIMSPGGSYMLQPGAESPIERPQSAVSNASQQYYDQSNLSVEDALPQNIEADNIMYHVTEIPENIDIADYENGGALNQSEDYILHTPLVQKQLTKTQMKRKNPDTKDNITPVPQKQARFNLQPLHIKTETPDVDPMSFLHMSPNLADPNSAGQNFNATLNAAMISPNNSQQLPDMEANSFMTGDMTTDLFEDNSVMLSDLVSGSYGDKYGMKSKPSSSGTAPKASGSKETASTSGRNAQSLTLAKYNNSKYVQDDVKRLSTADDVNDHLDIMQDDLDNLKDILRGEGYSFDTNALLGLFGDSDILNPFGLSLNSESSQEAAKKGSELMTYQPVAPEFIDLFEQDPRDKEQAAIERPESPSLPSSVLNTPYHE